MPVLGILSGSSSRAERNRERWVLHAHPALQDEATEWVKSHAKRKGHANMKIKHFMKNCNDELLCVGHPTRAMMDRPISISTARKWLIKLGFRVHHHKKGLFKDGHDDPEVIQYRQDVYLPQLKEWRKNSLLPEDFLDADGGYTVDVKVALEKARVRANSNGSV